MDIFKNIAFFEYFSIIYIFINFKKLFRFIYSQKGFAKTTSTQGMDIKSGQAMRDDGAV